MHTLTLTWIYEKLNINELDMSFHVICPFRMTMEGPHVAKAAIWLSTYNRFLRLWYDWLALNYSYIAINIVAMLINTGLNNYSLPTMHIGGLGERGNQTCLICSELFT